MLYQQYPYQLAVHHDAQHAKAVAKLSQAQDLKLITCVTNPKDRTMSHKFGCFTQMYINSPSQQVVSQAGINTTP
ncbi:hypothetical protein JCM21900_002915 [Sporobolomyces salmonicolor]